MKCLFTLVIAVLMLFMFANNIFADGLAPPISRFEVPAVGTGDINSGIQWTYLTDLPQGNIVFNNSGPKLYVMTRQLGYDAGITATYNGNPCYMADWAHIQDPYLPTIVIGRIYYWDCGGGTQSGTFYPKAISQQTGAVWTAPIYIFISSNAKIGSISYSSLNSAYNAITTEGVIKTKVMTFTENLNLNRDISFTLRGGYADDYINCIDFTNLNGVLTISSGSVVVDNLIISSAASVPFPTPTPPTPQVYYNEDI